ncbi:MAG: carboxymuconolactone decarboxylase family protein [Rhizobacter sp.]|jgi:AhpD family alkylhydroperoxidase
MSDHTRVPLVVPGTHAELAEVEARILAERGRVSPLYRVLLNSGPIASGWERLLTAVRNQTGVPPALRELVILRVAVLNGADFEFEAHVPHAEKAGVDAARLRAVREDGLSPVFSPIERLVLELTDTMTDDIQVPEDLFERLRPHFDATGLVELVATVAAYNMVSRFLVALQVGHVPS